MLMDSACTGSAGGVRAAADPLQLPWLKELESIQGRRMRWAASTFLAPKQPRAGSLHPAEITATLRTGRHHWGCFRGCSDIQQP